MDGIVSIRRLRRAAGLTQSDLSVRTAIPRETCQRIESGRLNPTAEEAGRLAEALGISPGDFEKALRRTGSRIWKGKAK